MKNLPAPKDGEEPSLEYTRISPKLALIHAAEALQMTKARRMTFIELTRFADIIVRHEVVLPPTHKLIITRQYCEEMLGARPPRVEGWRYGVLGHLAGEKVSDSEIEDVTDDAEAWIHSKPTFALLTLLVGVDDEAVLLEFRLNFYEAFFNESLHRLLMDSVSVETVVSICEAWPGSGDKLVQVHKKRAEKAKRGEAEEEEDDDDEDETTQEKFPTSEAIVCVESICHACRGFLAMLSPRPRHRMSEDCHVMFIMPASSRQKGKLGQHLGDLSPKARTLMNALIDSELWKGKKQSFKASQSVDLAIAASYDELDAQLRSGDEATRTNALRKTLEVLERWRQDLCQGATASLEESIVQHVEQSWATLCKDQELSMSEKLTRCSETVDNIEALLRAGSNTRERRSCVKSCSSVGRSV